MSRTLIENSLIFQNGTFTRDHVIVIKDEKIASIVPQADLIHYDKDTRIDAHGNYAIPGFVDVHIHGSNGFDTMDTTEDALQGLCDFLVQQGVTSVLPTTMSDTTQRITDALNAMAHFASHKHTPYIGVHLEGPYLNSDHRGSQPDTHLRIPQRDEYLEWFASGQVRLITMAPELDNGDLLIQDARDHNITTSLGHSGATYEQAHHAFEVGLSQITHTFNGMVGIHHRQPGAFIAATENPDITFQIISDGTHVHPAVINMLVKLVGTERVVVITDAMRATGLADGNYQLGDVDVIVSDGEARTRAGGLAGSTLTMPNALRNMMRFCDLSLAEVIPMLTRVPAQSIRMYPQKGSLNIGTDADIVLWNTDKGTQATLIGGEVVYQREVVL
jgi:N-acetylglucosamine-6-phosphate deacetylase